MTLLGVVGFSGSGKAVFCRIAQDEFGVVWLSSGALVRNEISRQGVPETPTNLRRVSEEIRQRHAGSFLAAMEEQVVVALGGGRDVVIDALREPSDLKFIRRFSCQAEIIAITATPEARFARIIARKRRGDPVSRDECEDLQRSEMKLGVADVIEAANYVVRNEGTLERFEGGCRDLLGRLLGGRTTDGLRLVGRPRGGN